MKSPVHILQPRDFRSFKKMGIALKLYLAGLAAALALSANAQSVGSTIVNSTAEIREDGAVVFYTGFINAKSVKQVLQVLDSAPHLVLSIQSYGGDVLSAIEFGSAIRRLGLDISVRRYCISSCANYIFTAGRNKVIEPESYVVWHGDARQKNFLERLEKLRKVVAESGISSLSQADQAAFSYMQKSIEVQDIFYASIGVNGRISRVGHEIGKPVPQWMLTPNQMEAFGVNAVTAPVNYGTESYCETMKGKPGLPKPVSCLQLTEEELRESASPSPSPSFLPR